MNAKLFERISKLDKGAKDCRRLALYSISKMAPENIELVKGIWDETNKLIQDLKDYHPKFRLLEEVDTPEIRYSSGFTGYKAEDFYPIVQQTKLMDIWSYGLSDEEE